MQGLRRRQGWIGLALCLFAASAMAHNEGGHDDDADMEGFIDCTKPPADALKALPEPLAQWASLECLPIGHKLVQGEQWLWRYPGSWTTRPEVPALAPEASRQQAVAKYFTALRVESLATDDVTAMHDRLSKESSMYRFYFETRPAHAYRIAARNNLGHDFEIFVPVETDAKLWGFPCVPACRPEYAFMMERR